MIWADYIPQEIVQLYEIHDYKHAAAILANEFPTEAREVFEALRKFRFTEEEVKKPGGNESNFPKKFSEILRPLGWVEDTLRAKMVVDDIEISHDTHKVDYLKGRVAFDLEWNSKDQTFDRDLYAFSTFFAYNKISVGVLVTRSNDLDPFFASLGGYIGPNGTIKQYKSKYGASTTHMGKLLPRLESGRNGGCPVLVFGITQKLLQKGDT
jgi:Restriction endonuclease BglII